MEWRYLSIHVGQISCWVSVDAEWTTDTCAWLMLDCLRFGVFRKRRRAAARGIAQLFPHPRLKAHLIRFIIANYKARNSLNYCQQDQPRKIPSSNGEKRIRETLMPSLERVTDWTLVVILLMLKVAHLDHAPGKRAMEPGCLMRSKLTSSSDPCWNRSQFESPVCRHKQ